MKTPEETSPLNLVQEKYRNDPWKLLVSCLILGYPRIESNSEQHRIVDDFFKRWPDPYSIIHEKGVKMGLQRKVIDFFKDNNVGMSVKKGTVIPKVTVSFCLERPDINENVDIEKFKGCGAFVRDSFDIFFRKKELKFDVIDSDLKSYVKWAALLD